MAQTGEFQRTSRDSDEVAHSREPEYVAAATLAEEIDRSRGWVSDMARKKLIPHVRLGPPPLPGRKDTRPVYFTREQADEIKALVNHVEYVPAGGVA